MKTFNKLFKTGTRVKLENGEWDIVKKVSENRKLIECKKFCGAFQRKHVVKFSNKLESETI